MTSVAENVVQAAEEVAPSAPVVEVAGAVAATVASPTIPVLAEDLLLAHKLAEDLKTQLAGKHPSLLNMIHWLIGL